VEKTTLYFSGSNMKTWLTAILLGVGSLLLFLAGIGNPPIAIYDEALYVNSGRALLAEGQDPSPYGPPLGKLLVAGSIRALGDNSFGWRAGSAVFGALTLVGMFLFTKLLLDNHALGLTAAALTFFNNFLFVLSRLAMMDIFLMTFALWGILAFTAALKMERLTAPARRALLFASGVLLGFSGACKWNAVDELCVIAAIGAFLLIWSGRSKNPEMIQYGANLREAGTAWFLVSFSALPLLAYSATFWPLCRMLHVPFTTSQLLSMNVYIWRFHRAVVGNRAIAMAWYQWPLLSQPQRGLSYLVGNWYVMWAGLAAGLFCLRRFARSLPETLILLLYAANLLQWAVTPQSLTYYYYYFPAAMFLGLAIPVALHRLPAQLYGVRLSFVAVLPAACIFAYCLAHMAHLDAPYDSILGYWP
jgi:4-amino-4-deoxy-L-arabinose transferase-like glycosyltransferase